MIEKQLWVDNPHKSGLEQEFPDWQGEPVQSKWDFVYLMEYRHFYAGKGCEPVSDNKVGYIGAHTNPKTNETVKADKPVNIRTKRKMPGHYTINYGKKGWRFPRRIDYPAAKVYYIYNGGGYTVRGARDKTHLLHDWKPVGCTLNPERFHAYYQSWNVKATRASNLTRYDGEYSDGKITIREIPGNIYFDYSKVPSKDFIWDGIISDKNWVEPPSPHQYGRVKGLPGFRDNPNKSRSYPEYDDWEDISPVQYFEFIKGVEDWEVVYPIFSKFSGTDTLVVENGDIWKIPVYGYGTDTRRFHGDMRHVWYGAVKYPECNYHFRSGRVANCDDIGDKVVCLNSTLHLKSVQKVERFAPQAVRGAKTVKVIHPVTTKTGTKLQMDRAPVAVDNFKLFTYTTSTFSGVDFPERDIYWNGEKSDYQQMELPEPHRVTFHKDKLPYPGGYAGEQPKDRWEQSGMTPKSMDYVSVPCHCNYKKCPMGGTWAYQPRVEGEYDVNIRTGWTTFWNNPRSKYAPFQRVLYGKDVNTGKKTSMTPQSCQNYRTAIVPGTVKTEKAIQKISKAMRTELDVVFVGQVDNGEPHVRQGKELFPWEAGGKSNNFDNQNPKQFYGDVGKHSDDGIWYIDAILFG